MHNAKITKAAYIQYILASAVGYQAAPTVLWCDRQTEFYMDSWLQKECLFLYDLAARSQSSVPSANHKRQLCPQSFQYQLLIHYAL